MLLLFILKYITIGYLWLFYWWLLLVILLMAIGDYLKLNYHILLIPIGGFISLMAIGVYFSNGY
jgi:hypothetical protein